MMDKKKFIEIYDDVIPFNLVNHLEEVIISNISYKFIKNVTNSLIFDDYNPALAHQFIDWENPQGNSPNTQHFLSQILYRLCQFKNISITQIFQGRIFLHLPNPNPSPNNIHNDLPFPHLVCLYYVTDSDGDTILYEDDEKTEIQRVTPKKGRIVFFDGSIKHCSSKPSKTHRAIVNFDFTGEYLDKQK